MTEVRCLGPREPEHTFMTDDPCKHRICPRCRSAIAGTRLAKAEEPMTLHWED